jgi:Purple acid Phosphatase, N-terminal domain
MKNMRRILTALATSLMFLAMGAWAQKSMDQKPAHQMDEKSEKAVQITQGPTITWTTDKPGANHVRYRVAGSNGEWKSAYHSGGGTTHNLQFTGLEPSKTYEWQILTRDGDVRQQGQFQTK